MTAIMTKEKLHSYSLGIMIVALLCGVILLKNIYQNVLLVDLSVVIWYLSVIMYALTDQKPIRKAIVLVLVCLLAIGFLYSVFKMH